MTLSAPQLQSAMLSYLKNPSAFESFSPLDVQGGYGGGHQIWVTSTDSNRVRYRLIFDADHRLCTYEMYLGSVALNVAPLCPTWNAEVQKCTSEFSRLAQVDPPPPGMAV